MDITRITTTAGDDIVLGPLRKQVNRGAMVAWINHDIINRAGCDIRKSVVLYDAQYVFVMALPADITADVFASRLASLPNTVAAMHRAGIRYWSRGLV